MNKLLIIDLTKKSYRAEQIAQSVLDDYLGGRGLGAYLIYHNLPGRVNPISSDNIIIFSCGPAQGTNAYYSSRAVLTTKSPLTDAYLYSIASGRLGHDMKRAGYAAIMIAGRAADPVYLIINDEKVEFRSAKPFWGQMTEEAQAGMLEDAKIDGASTVCIGPAGERLMKLAVVATEGDKIRTFARGGPGAVMGSKNLKGLVVFGSQKVRIANKSSFAEAQSIIRELIKNNQVFRQNRRRFGTGSDMMVMNEIGILPTRNWQTGVFKNVTGIALTEIEETWPRQNVSCGPYCINPCSHTIELDHGPWKGAKTEGPEYETIYAFGSNCGVDQFDAIVAAEEICDQYGIDTISCGLSVSFAMECFEKGLISKKDTEGIDLRFGNAEGMVETVKRIAQGQGIGALLGEGVRRASEKIPGSSGFAMHVKGLEFGGYECRGLWGQALQFALSSRGACHHAFGLPARIPAELQAPTQLEGKGSLVKNSAIARVLYDSAILCALNISVVGLDTVTKVLNSLTGKGYLVEDWKKVGFRVINLERLFNIREGLGRQDDILPKRLLEDPLPEGPRKGSTVPIDALLEEGYRAMGWDIETGVPLKETLDPLGLGTLLSK